MFKVGDVVRIKDLKGISSEILDRYWISEMVYFIGLEYIIDFIDSDGDVWLTQSNYVWHPDMLELVEDVSTPISDVDKPKEDFKDEHDLIIERYEETIRILKEEKTRLIKHYEKRINSLEELVKDANDVTKNIIEDYDGLKERYNKLVSKYNARIEMMKEDFID